MKRYYGYVVSPMLTFQRHLGYSLVPNPDTLVNVLNQCIRFGKLLCKAAGIEWCTPHSLRHTGITEAVHAKDADVVDVSRLVGHKNLKTTMGYIHVADERLHKSVAQMPKIVTV